MTARTSKGVHHEGTAHSTIVIARARMTEAAGIVTGVGGTPWIRIRAAEEGGTTGEAADGSCIWSGPPIPSNDRITYR